MANNFDVYDQALVISGFDKGIAPDPYEGIANLQSVNISSIPGEASVMFGTALISSPDITGMAVTSATTGTSTGYITFGGGLPAGLENGMAISFTGSNITGVTAGTTVYWVSSISGNNVHLYTDYPNFTISPDITTSGTATCYTYFVDFSNEIEGSPNRFALDSISGNSYMADSQGRVWSNVGNTSPSNYWTFTGNQQAIVGAGSTSFGNGLVFYPSQDLNHGYLFVFSNSRIDYLDTKSFSSGWQYGWDPTSHSVNNAAGYLNTPNGNSNSHEALVGQDNAIYFCDAQYIYSVIPTGTPNFSPTDGTSFTANKQALALPSIEKAICLAELGTSLLAGGQRNLIYPWDRISTSFSYPIFLSESFVSKMVTVNTNTFIFTGNRGRIYITNGSQAQMFAKVPDHISETVEPYFIWGGATFLKNQLLFSMQSSDNNGTVLPGYGGVWAIDLTSNAMRNMNTLSVGTTVCYALSIAPITQFFSGGSYSSPTNPTGFGFYAGWYAGNTLVAGAGKYGLDGTTFAPYTNSMSIIETDLIPIGTYNKRRNFSYIEYKLSQPLVSGESINIYSRTDFKSAYNTSPVISDSTAGHFSDTAPIDVNNVQWIQFKVVLNSTATTPSYVRLKEIRLGGLIGPTLGQQDILSI